MYVLTSFGFSQPRQQWHLMSVEALDTAINTQQAIRTKTPRMQRGSQQHGGFVLARIEELL